jgi:heme/copper-type cytochrome/quinol oxidase subunit 2
MRDSLRWLAVPIAAYLVITLGLPAAHGAARQTRFATHAMWVVLGCAIIVVVIVAVIVAVIAASRALANKRNRSRVAGGPS